MFDSIPHIGIDSIPFYLNRVEESVDTFSTSFVPFDIVPTDDLHLFFDIDTTVVDSIGSHIEGVAGLPIMFTSSMQNILFSIFVCCFLLLALFTRREGMNFLATLKGIVSFSAIKRSAFKEQITISAVWVNIYIVIQAVIVLSIIAAVVLWKESDRIVLPVDNIFLLLGCLFVGIMIFILSKYFIYVLIDYTFPDWKLREWFSQYFTVVGILGLSMFLPALLITFAPEYYKISMWLLLCMLVIIMFFYYRNLLIIFVKNNIGLLNYFLYLCAIEIVPLFLIYRGGMILANIAGK